MDTHNMEKISEAATEKTSTSVDKQEKWSKI